MKKSSKDNYVWFGIYAVIFVGIIVALVVFRPRASENAGEPYGLPSVDVPVLANFKTALTFPKFRSYEPISETDLPIPKDKWMRQDAAQVSIFRVEFVDGTEGYAGSYFVPDGVYNYVYKFIASSLNRSSGWDVLKSFFTPDIGDHEISGNGYQARIITFGVTGGARVEIIMQKI